MSGIITTFEQRAMQQERRNTTKSAHTTPLDSNSASEQMSVTMTNQPSGRNRASYVMYEQMLSSCFDKIRKNIPKKAKSLKELCDSAIEELKADENDEVLSANKYFRVMKLALDTRNTRLTEHILYHVQKLVAHGLMDGNHPDDCLYPEDERPKMNGSLPRKLIDAIVDEVCKCTSERDTQVQLQVVRALLTLVATRKVEVHEKSLLKVLSSLYYIHIASTNPVNQNTARASLIQLIKIVFNKMESADTSKRLSTGQPLSVLLNPDSRAESGRASSTEQESQKADQEEFVTFSACEIYAHNTLTFMVDNVAIHHAKQQEIRQHHEQLISQLRVQGADDASIQRQITLMNEELESIPLSAVPSGKRKKKDKAQPKEEEKAERPNLLLMNEQGIPAGKFGWCVCCRGTANLYCKHTRHPVCSFECKKQHIKMLEEAAEQADQRAQANNSTVSSTRLSIGGMSAMDDPLTKDALLVFNKLCQLLQNPDLDRKLDNVYDVKKVLLGLDLIHSCLESPGHVFTSRREFVLVVRDQLCNALIKFAASPEHKIFARTVSIFQNLFLNFREHIKQSVGVFIDTIFLSMLDSGNSEYDYKYSIIEFFDKMADNPEHILEIFANFDCDVHGKNTCQRLIDTMSKLAKLEMSHASTVITPQQENSLRRQALEILVKIVRNLNRTIDTTVELEQAAQAKLAERREQRALEQEDNTPLTTETSVEGMDAKVQMQNLVYKQIMTTAAKKFNQKPKNGLKYLVEHGYLQEEPEIEYIKGITKFFKENPALSPTEIGKYLGGEKDFNKAVLTQYIEEFDWTNESIDFLTAMKELLGGFRIPGEGQIVDRVMEKFGEKLARDRPEDFGNAEGVFLFAYAVLMVQTSIHNPQAQKCKMSLADFKKITSTVKLSNTKEIDFDKFRARIYERVEREPFTLEEDEDLRMKLEAQNNTNKKQLFDKEREMQMRRGKKLLTTKQGQSNAFMLVKDTSTILPMFENTWQAYLAVFSFVMDQTDDPVVANLCLQGFIHGIRISGHYQMHDVRDLLVSSLAKFSQVKTDKEIRLKNINCIRGLLNLAVKDGEILRDSWKHVLDCVSKIDSLRVLGLGEVTDSEIFKAQPSASNNAQIMRNAAIIAEQIDGNQIEQIFLQSEKLNTNAIIDFIENLCKVSREELNSEDNPKKFCLQKLVEVASLNMNRVRFQWNSIWQMLGDHFTWVGSHKNLNVVIYAIDSLRQLSDKFLEKDERKNFHYQKMFLKPFETIMLNNLHSTTKEIKEYVVMCISALCNQKAKYIRSGWEVILNIFTLAAQDTTERHLVDQSFRSIEHAIAYHFHLIEESYIELVNCLSKFSRNGSTDQTTKVLQLLMMCAGRLRDCPEIIDNFTRKKGQAIHQLELEARQRLQPTAYGIQTQMDASLQAQVPGGSPTKYQSDDVRLSVMQALWFPILRNFTGLMMDKNTDIRGKALEAFVGTLEESYLAFGEDLWREIFGQIMLPMLEDIKVQIEVLRKKNTPQFEKQIEVQVQTLQQIFSRLNDFFSVSAVKLGPSLMSAYSDSICLFLSKVNTQEVVDVTASSLTTLVIRIGSEMHSNFWSDLTTQIQLLLDQTVPKLIQNEMKNVGETDQIMTSVPTVKKGQAQQVDVMRNKFEQCYAKCAVQLQITNLMLLVVPRYFDAFNNNQIQGLLSNCDQLYKFAIEFNSEINLRYAMWKRGYMAVSKDLPGLLDLEELSLKAYLSILFKCFKKGANSQHDDVSGPLFALCSKVLKDYSLKNSELLSIDQRPPTHVSIDSQATNEEALARLRPFELRKQLEHLSPIISDVILENMLKLSDGELKQQASEMGQLMIDLTVCDSVMVRQKNHKLLTRLFEHLQAK